MEKYHEWERRRRKKKKKKRTLEPKKKQIYCRPSGNYYCQSMAFLYRPKRQTFSGVWVGNRPCDANEAPGPDLLLVTAALQYNNYLTCLVDEARRKKQDN